MARMTTGLLRWDEVEYGEERVAEVWRQGPGGAHTRVTFRATRPPDGGEHRLTVSYRVQASGLPRGWRPLFRRAARAFSVDRTVVVYQGRFGDEAALESVARRIAETFEVDSDGFVTLPWLSTSTPTSLDQMLRDVARAERVFVWSVVVAAVGIVGLAFTAGWMTALLAADPPGGPQAVVVAPELAREVADTVTLAVDLPGAGEPACVLATEGGVLGVARGEDCDGAGFGRSVEMRCAGYACDVLRWGAGDGR